MISRDLFEKVLVEPAIKGGRKLKIVTGYATPSMAFHHIDFLRRQGIEVQVEIVLGMCPSDGLGRSHHLGFTDLVENEFEGRITCSYLTEMPPVHSKMYIWLDENDIPVCAFVGSANYTQSGFRNSQREVMVECDPAPCLEYFENLCDETIYCEHPEADQEVVIYDDREFRRRRRRQMMSEDVPEEGVPAPIEGLPHVNISLLARNGTLAARSGLNWGQRPEYNRDPNQAYIRVPMEINRLGFFPPAGVHFTLLTDDDRALTVVRAQDSAKAIETPHDNSRLGEYFRNRLGLASGAMVTIEDLERYGRTDIDFYKIDDETYYMDFSRPNS